MVRICRVAAGYASTGAAERATQRLYRSRRSDLRLLGGRWRPSLNGEPLQPVCPPVLVGHRVVAPGGSDEVTEVGGLETVITPPG